MFLITEINEDVVNEANIDGSGNYFIEGIYLQGNIKNRNGRKYPTELLVREVARYNREYIQKSRAYGELGHPEGPTINLDKVSHIIKELVQDGDNFRGRAKIMNTPNGKIVKNIMDEGGIFGVSSRAMGSLKRVGNVNVVQNDLYIASVADIVADPSAPEAFVNGIMEGKEWLMEGGLLIERDIKEYQRQMNAASKAKREKSETQILKIWEHFCTKL